MPGLPRRLGALALAAILALGGTLRAQGRDPDPGRPFIEDDETRELEADTRRCLGADFRVVRTAHYLLRTDCDTAYARDAALRLEALFDGFHRVFADELSLEPPPGRMDLAVYLFEDVEGFRLYKHAELPDAHEAQGFYDPRGNRLLLYREFQAGREVTDIKLLHEAAHQLLHRRAGLAPTVDARVWLLEGLACYFETSRLDPGGEPAFGQVHPHRLQSVRRAIEDSSWTPLSVLVSLGQRSFVGGGGELGNLHYAQAWALVHFLLHGEEGAWRERFFEFVREASGAGTDEARFREVFGDVALLEGRWKDYLLGLRADGGS
ncbi:MAG: DUF1570 domain-containing protein [Planctomycetes bacterium]|nr:DUF1570 domain-containing protein [Planctomycetota bacterium]